MSQVKTRVGLYVDVQNVYYTTRAVFGRSFNYRGFWAHINSQYQLVYARAYAVQRDDDAQIKFQDALRHIGFDVRLKKFIQRADGSAKGDWDVGITIDMIEQAGFVDEVILLSGDGDFSILLDHIKKKYAIRTTVYGVEALTAQALIQASSTFHAIDNHWLLPLKS